MDKFLIVCVVFFSVALHFVEPSALRSDNRIGLGGGGGGLGIGGGGGGLGGIAIGPGSLGEIGNGLGINISLQLPPLSLAIQLSSLISLEAAINIIENHKPTSPSQVAPCDTVPSRPLPTGGSRPPPTGGSRPPPTGGSRPPPIGGPSPPLPPGRNGITDDYYRWYKDTNYFIPYVIDPQYNDEDRQIIFAGLTDIERRSCFRFRLYQSEDQVQGFDYVYVYPGEYCNSFIGRQHSGKQILNLKRDDGTAHCMWSGTVAHEFIHAIGFDHQQNAPGRDNYVTINWENIECPNGDGQPGCKYHNFKEDSATAFSEYGETYDYVSIMHYRKTDFSWNGMDTITPKANVEIGVTNTVSYIDARKINKMHQCPVE